MAKKTGTQNEVDDGKSGRKDLEAGPPLISDMVETLENLSRRREPDQGQEDGAGGDVEPEDSEQILSGDDPAAQES